jgi:hypothetical protein
MEGPRPAAIAGAGGRNTLHPLICAAIVAAAAVLAYLNSFQGAFQLDDYKVVLSDPAVLGGLGCLDRQQGLISGNLLWVRVMPQPVSAVEC